MEIKGGRATYQSVAARGRPPRHHYAQLQHILAVTGLAAVDYWCFMPGLASLRLEVRRDDAYLARLIASEAEFWARVTAQAERAQGRGGGDPSRVTSSGICPGTRR